MFHLLLGVLAVSVCLASAEVVPLDHPDGVAESHDHWDHIVRRRSAYSFFESRKQDETSHIVDVQEYYRKSFDQGWDTAGYGDSKYGTNEQEMLRLIKMLKTVMAQGKFTNKDKASIQEETSHMLEVNVDSKPIPGRYLVMLQSNADDYTLDRTVEVLAKANSDSEQRIRASDIHTLRNVGKGFVATLNSQTLDLLKRHPLVEHIEEDMALRRSEFNLRIPKDTESVETEGHSVLWNLDRLDQRSNKLDGQYSPEGTGKNVDIYIIDTGVMATHQEFGNRVKYAGFDAVDFLTGSNNRGKDCNGHGTHCAGTAAGKTYGVAKEAGIYNLRALNCQGTGAVSGIVTGIDKIVDHYKKRASGNPAVISQSLGVKKSPSLNMAIQHATDAGIVMVGAAGNQADYSCKYSPASARVGIAVGATDMQDNVLMFSNTGECTDIMAPGYQIKSASIQCDTCTKTMSGTSMAGPHAAGSAAILLGLHPQLNAVQVKKRMSNIATKGAVIMSARVASRDHAHETPNLLLYVPPKTAKDSDIGDVNVASVQSEWAPK